MADESIEPEYSLGEKVAQAIYGSLVEQARKAASERDPDVARIRRVFDAAFRETDRSAAILVFALAEDMMAEGLRQNLNNEIRGGWSSALEPTGLLGTAANRITLLHMLDWIRPETANDLLTLKSIRNRFAHHAELDGFTDQKIRSWIANLQRVEEPVQKLMREKYDELPFSPREQYLARACSVISRLAFDLIVGPISKKRGVNPNDVIGPSFEDALPKLKEVHYALAKLIRKILLAQT